MRYNRVKKDQQEMYIYPGADGVWRVVYKATVFFESEEVMKDFDEWFKSEGLKAFTEYQERLGRDTGRDDS